MALNEVTEDSLMMSGMSLLGSDQAQMNMGMPSIVFSAAQGAMEGTLNLVNADTITDERLRAEIEQKKEKDNDGVEIAMQVMSDSVEENLRKLRDGQVTYSNGQFNIGGLLVDEEDMDATVDSMVDNFDDVVAQQNLNAQESAILMALLVEYQNTDDPQAKAQILDKIRTDVSPDVAADMGADAKNRQEQRQELTAEETKGQAVAQTTTNTEWKQATVAIVDDKARIVDLSASRTNVDVGEANPFADVESSMDGYNAAAQGEVQVAEADIAHDAPAASNVLTQSL